MTRASDKRPPRIEQCCRDDLADTERRNPSSATGREISAASTRKIGNNTDVNRPADVNAWVTNAGAM